MRQKCRKDRHDRMSLQFQSRFPEKNSFLQRKSATQNTLGMGRWEIAFAEKRVKSALIRIALNRALKLRFFQKSTVQGPFLSDAFPHTGRSDKRRHTADAGTIGETLIEFTDRPAGGDAGDAMILLILVGAEMRFADPYGEQGKTIGRRQKQKIHHGERLEYRRTYEMRAIDSCRKKSKCSSRGHGQIKIGQMPGPNEWIKKTSCAEYAPEPEKLPIKRDRQERLPPIIPERCGQKNNGDAQINPAVTHDKKRQTEHENILRHVLRD